MYCNGVAVPDCVLDYMPSINKNVAGNIFAGKVNFVLAGESLYVKQRVDTLSAVNGFPALGLNIYVREGNVCVTALEINGLAEKSVKRQIREIHPTGRQPYVRDRAQREKTSV